MVMDKTGKEGDRGLTDPAKENLSQPSAVEKLTSSIEEGKQYPGADVKKLVDDALSADGREQKGRADKAEAEVTRLTGQVNGFTTQVNTLTSQMTEITKAQNEAELAKVSEDPAALSSLRARQANAAEAIRLTGVEATQNARNTTLGERETAVGQKEISVNIKLVAIATGVDEKKLAELVPDGDATRLTNAANLLKQSGTPEIDPLTGKPKPVALTQPPASAISAASGGETGVRQIVDRAKKRAGVQ